MHSGRYVSISGNVAAVSALDEARFALVLVACQPANDRKGCRQLMTAKAAGRSGARGDRFKTQIFSSGLTYHVDDVR